MTLQDFVSRQPDGPRRLASARARLRARNVLLGGVERSGFSKKELADKLGVGKSAVSEVLNGNGNVRVNTLSDYLFECGRELVIGSRPLGSGRRYILPATTRLLSSTTVDAIWGSPQGVTVTCHPLPHAADQTLLGVKYAVEAHPVTSGLQSITEKAVAREQV